MSGAQPKQARLRHRVDLHPDPGRGTRSGASAAARSSAGSAPSGRSAATDGLTRKQAEHALRRVMGEVASSRPRSGSPSSRPPSATSTTSSTSWSARHRPSRTTGSSPPSTSGRTSTPRRSRRSHPTTSSPTSPPSDAPGSPSRRSPTTSTSRTAYSGIAVRRGWTTANPVAATERPRVVHTDPDIRFLNREELEALLRAVPRDDVLGPTEYALYTVAAMTGLRQGELVALRWRDIDWTAGVVRVRRTYSRGEWGTPKSRRSSRAVPLADRAAARARAPLPALGLPRRRRPRLLPPAHRQPLRRLEAARTLLRRDARRRHGPPRRAPGRHHLPLAAAHLRHPHGRRRRADAHAPGVDGAPRPHDHADLRRLRSRPKRRRGLRRASVRRPGTPGRPGRSSDRRGILRGRWRALTSESTSATPTRSPYRSTRSSRAPRRDPTGGCAVHAFFLALAPGAKLTTMADQPHKDAVPPAKPTNIPKPGTVPKLPQTIFNLEKRGGSSRTRRIAGSRTRISPTKAVGDF